MAVLMALTVFAPVLTSFADEEDEYYYEESDSGSSGAAADSGDLSDDFFDEDGSEGRNDVDPSEDYILDDEEESTGDSDFDEDEAYILDEESEKIQNKMEEEDSPFFRELAEELREKMRRADPDGKIFTDKDIVLYTNFVRGIIAESEKIISVFANPTSKEKDRKVAVSTYKEEMNKLSPGLADSAFVKDFLSKDLESTVKQVKAVQDDVLMEAITEMYSQKPSVMMDEETSPDLRNRLNGIMPGLGEGEYAEKLERIVSGSVQAGKDLFSACLEHAAKKTTPKKEIEDFRAELNELFPGFGDSKEAVNFANGMYEASKKIQKTKDTSMENVINLGYKGNADGFKKEKEAFQNSLLKNPEISVNEEILEQFVEKACNNFDVLYDAVDREIGNALGNFFSGNLKRGFLSDWKGAKDGVKESKINIEEIYPGFNNLKIIQDARNAVHKYILSYISSQSKEKRKELNNLLSFGMFADHAAGRTGRFDDWDDLVRRAPLKFISAWPKTYKLFRSEIPCPKEYFRGNDYRCQELEKIISERRAAGKKGLQPKK